MDDDTIIDAILKREGGWSNQASDRGHQTMRGITLSTYSAWLHRPATVEELKALTEGEARQIYRALYIDQPGFSKIENPQIRGLVVDAGVNHGPTVSVRMLQRALAVPVDGALGPVTIAALKAAAPGPLYFRLCAQRVRFYGSIISHDHSQAVFASGWASRVAELIEEGAAG